MENHKSEYERIWGMPIGQDCITLNVTLGKWLGERLIYLSYREHLGCPLDYPGGDRSWQKAMLRHGQALLEYGNEVSENSQDAKSAMIWVAKNFDHLWH